MSLNVIGFFVHIVCIASIGGKGHKPRWIGFGLIVTSVGMMTLALPHFITRPYVYSTTASSSSTDVSCVIEWIYTLNFILEI